MNFGVVPVIRDAPREKEQVLVIVLMNGIGKRKRQLEQRLKSVVHVDIRRDS